MADDISSFGFENEDIKGGVFDKYKGKKGVIERIATRLLEVESLGEGALAAGLLLRQLVAGPFGFPEREGREADGRHQAIPANKSPWTCGLRQAGENQIRSRAKFRLLPSPWPAKPPCAFHGTHRHVFGMSCSPSYPQSAIRMSGRCPVSTGCSAPPPSPPPARAAPGPVPPPPPPGR